MSKKNQHGLVRRIAFKGIGILLILAIAISGIIGWYYQHLTRPLPAQIKVQTLHGKLKLFEDRFGVPLVASQHSDLDVFYGQGFQHAKDRLWQMELQRRLVQGRLSELFGQRTIDKDRFYRTLGLYRAAAKTWEVLSPQTKAILRAYADGVNAYIAQGTLPMHYLLLRAKPEPWTPIDSLAWQKMMAWNLNQMWIEKLKTQTMLQEYGPETLSTFWPAPPHDSTILSSDEVRQAKLPIHSKTYHLTQHFNHDLKLHLYDIQAWHDHQPGKGSNNWVISGSKTQSGMPILASDPHLKLTQPGPWYIIQLQGPSIALSGASLVGLPGIMIGHNQTIAWGVTNVEPNVQDIFIEANPQDISTYQETILIKGSPAETLMRRESPRGPIISDVLLGETNYPLSLRWVGIEADDTTTDSLLMLNRAQNWQDFVNAVDKFVVPALNIVYADIDGNIGYYMAGKIPIREDNLNPTPVLPNQTTLWTDYIPTKDLPHILNPESGFIATANNKVVPDEYAYQINYLWKESHYRSKRIKDLIEANQAHNIQSSVEIQQDTLSYLWGSLKPQLCSIEVTEHKALHDQMCRWDGDMQTKRIEPTLFALWFQRIKQMLPQNQGMLKTTANSHQYFIQEQLSEEGAYCRAETGTCNDFLQQTYHDAIEDYLAHQGMNEVTWGGLHQLTLTDPVLEQIPFVKKKIRRTIATPGGQDTVNVGAYRDQFKHHHGAGYRQIIDLNDMSQSLMILVMGQSQYPWSKHYDDLLYPWANKQYLQVHQIPLELTTTLLPKEEGPSNS